MAVLALAFAALALQSTESQIEGSMAIFKYKAVTQPTVGGVELRLTREVPIFGGGGAQSAGQQGGFAPPADPPKPIRVLIDEARFLLLAKPEKTPQWASLTNQYAIDSVYLGKLGNHHVYGQAPLAELVHVAKGFKFIGGTDWRTLAAKGASLFGTEGYKSHGFDYYFAGTGDSSLPFLLKALKNSPTRPWHLVLSIGQTRGPASTRELRRLYRSKDQLTSQASAYALIHKPFRPEAKPEYLDMLARGIYLGTIATEMPALGWTEALPLLQKAKVESYQMFDLVTIMEVERTLAKKPVPQEIKSAFAAIGSHKDKDKTQAKETLLAYEDKELLAAYALLFKNYITKADTKEANAFGNELLAKLPEEAVNKVKARIKPSKD